MENINPQHKQIWQNLTGSDKKLIAVSTGYHLDYVYKVLNEKRYNEEIIEMANSIAAKRDILQGEIESIVTAQPQ